VAEDDREDHRHPAEAGVVVGVADADGLDPDQDLVAARVVEVDLLDRQLRARLPGDGRLDLHRHSRRMSRFLIILEINLTPSRVKIHHFERTAAPRRPRRRPRPRGRPGRAATE